MRQEWLEDIEKKRLHWVPFLFFLWLWGMAGLADLLGSGRNKGVITRGALLKKVKSRTKMARSRSHSTSSGRGSRKRMKGASGNRVALIVLSTARDVDMRPASYHVSHHAYPLGTVASYADIRQSPFSPMFTTIGRRRRSGSSGSSGRSRSSRKRHKKSRGQNASGRKRSRKSESKSSSRKRRRMRYA